MQGQDTRHEVAFSGLSESITIRFQKLSSEKTFLYGKLLNPYFIVTIENARSITSAGTHAAFTDISAVFCALVGKRSIPKVVVKQFFVLSGSDVA